MLPGTGYFKSIDCPFFSSGLCERPYCHYLHRRRLSFSPEPEETTPVPTPVVEGPALDAKGHRLYLPPPNAPVYKPTPKALLQGDPSTPKPYIPSSLAQVANLQKPQLAGRSNKKRTLQPKEVLGDIGDLSSSDEEDKNLDVIGSILLQGVKSGVLGGEVSEFQHELIKNTIKAKNKTKPASPKKSGEEKIVIVISDDEESLKETQRKKEVEEEERKKRVLEEERLEAKRVLEEKEKELEELERKRKVLENFYKKTTVDSTAETKESEPRHEKHKKSKYKSRKRKRSRRKYSKKKSKRRRSSSSSSTGSSSTSFSSSNSSSDSSSTDESDSETERRRHRRKRSRHKKSKSSSRDKKYASKRDKMVEIPPEIKKEKVDPPVSLPVIKQEKLEEVKIKEEPKDLLTQEANLETLNEGIGVPSPSQIKDEDLPESVKTFLSAMEEIDLKLEQKQSSPEHKKARSSKSRDSRSSSSTKNNEVESRSKSSTKSTHRDHHSSRSDEKKSHSKSSSKGSSSKGLSKSSSSSSSKHSSSSSSKHSSSNSSKHSSSSSSKHSSSSSSKHSSSSSLKHSSSKDPSSSSRSSSAKSSANKASSDLKLPKSEDSFSEILEHDTQEAAGGSNDYFDNDSGPDDTFEKQDEELRRIFEEHERQVRDQVPTLPKKVPLPEAEKNKESLNPKSKKRVAHKADTDSSQSARPPSVRRPISATQQMLERFKKIQSMRENSEIESRLASLEGAEAAPKMNKSSRVLSVPPKRTVSTTNKGVARVSHVPTVDISKPLIAPDMNSKVPSGIRQRYLDSIVEECLKIYSGDKGNAYARATKEEQLCCDRSKNRNIYLNVVVNCIKRLRTEASQAPKSKHSTLPPQRNMVTSHLQILAGKGGSKGSWSIEKPKSSLDENSLGLVYAILKRYVLSKEVQVENGYPMMDPEVKGKAFISVNSHYSNRKPQPPEADKRRCDRCSALYKVNGDGKQTEVGECIFHWGRLHRQRANRALGPTSGYYCCNGDTNSDGCEVSQTHITEMEDTSNMRGFVSAFSASIEAHDGNYGIFALDCEMCYTTHGNELTRVTVVNYEGATVYEALVKPLREVIDYNTRFSGISPNDLENVTTTIRDVQAVLLSMFSAETILIGHSLESDLKALKMVHPNVVDSSIVYPHKMGPPYKRALKHLAAEHLKRIIQNDVGGHDSAEDALAALDLMKVKVKSDIKKLQQDSAKANL